MGFTYSPLRFPGGKHRYWRYLRSVLIKDNRKIDKFYEVFAGGSGLGLSLLNHKLISELYLNDKDPFIHALWDQILSDPSELIDLINNTEPTLEGFDKHKKSFRKNKKKRRLF